MAFIDANTALCFALSGLALWWHGAEAAERRLYGQGASTGKAPLRARRLYGQGCGLVVIVVALLSLAEYVFVWNAGIDQWLFKASATDSATVAASYPGLMSPATAFNFSCSDSRCY